MLFLFLFLILKFYQGTSVGKRCTNVIFNGGAAYALSRKTICKLSRVFHTVEFLEPADPKNCFVTCSDCYSIDGEDYLLGNCLKMIGMYLFISLY